MNRDSLVKYSLGIDVSGDSLECKLVAIKSDQEVRALAGYSFDNRQAKFDSLHKWLQKQLKYADLPLCVVMEATGVYYEAIAQYLYDQGYSVSVVLPNKAKRYMQSLGLKSKTDRIDASGLARMGAEQRLSTWEPMSAEFAQLRTLTRHLRRLQELKTDVRHQLEAHRRMNHTCQIVIGQQEQMMKWIEAQIRDGKQEVEKHVESYPELNAQVHRIMDDLQGVGILTVCVILAETNGFKLFGNVRQLISFCGYDVKENQSGKFKGKAKISKQGNSHVRRILHMPALNVVRFGVEPFVSVWQRVYENSGVKMKAYVAIQRKLLALIYTLYKKQEAFRVPSVDESVAA